MSVELGKKTVQFFLRHPISLRGQTTSSDPQKIEQSCARSLEDLISAVEKFTGSIFFWAHDGRPDYQLERTGNQKTFLASCENILPASAAESFDLTELVLRLIDRQDSAFAIDFYFVGQRARGYAEAVGRDRLVAGVFLQTFQNDAAFDLVQSQI